MKKAILKEWFPKKEEFAELEKLYKSQIQIYDDSADAGIFYSEKIHSIIKRLLNELSSVYGGKIVDKWGNEKQGGVSYTIFIPFERSDYGQGKYDGSVVTVGLHKDIKLKSVRGSLRNPEHSDKFYSIEIRRVTGVHPMEAERDYKSTFFKG